VRLWLFTEDALVLLFPFYYLYCISAVIMSIFEGNLSPSKYFQHIFIIALIFKMPDN